MNLLKKLFTKEEPIKSNSDFWNWFVKKEKTFHNVIKKQGDIDKVFFSKLSPKLKELKEGYWFLAGMCGENTAELILTADGNIKNIVFVEELISSAPKIDGWKITALKPPSPSNAFAIEMDGYKFDEEYMSFYSNDLEDFPDEIDITITHKDLNEENRGSIVNGVFLCLDNSLGELKSVTTIDNVTIINPKDAVKELVPLEKLSDFLIWREKEFIEKYEGVRHNTENDNYSGLEATLKNGQPLLAVINSDLLNWDRKVSHPWILKVKIRYDGRDNNGMPNEEVYKTLNTIEDELMIELKDFDGYLNIGRQTAENIREIYFACTDFRKPSKVLYNIQKH